MIAKISTLRWGLSSALLVNLPGLLQLSASTCTGLCGACGGGCAIAGLTAGGFFAATRFYKILRVRAAHWRQSKTGPPAITAAQALHRAAKTMPAHLTESG